MASSRVTKLPDKYSDCILGDDIDSFDNPDNVNNEVLYEIPKKHDQINGKTNNVSFKTLRVNSWKSAIIGYFGEANTCVQIQKTCDVLKINFEVDNEKNNTAKINLYHTGSVTIQGAKCAQFADKFFSILKNECDNHDLHQTGVKSCNLSVHTDATNLKTADQKETDCSVQSNEIEMKTPKIRRSKSAHDINILNSLPTPEKTPETVRALHSPQLRVAQHNKTMDAKFTTIRNSISALDQTMLNLVEKISDITVATRKIPDNISAKINEVVNTHKSKISESISAIESKVKHCATGIDALQTKANLADNLMKELKNNQDEHKTTVEKLSTVINKLVERIEVLEDHVASVKVHQTSVNENLAMPQSSHDTAPKMIDEGTDPIVLNNDSDLSEKTRMATPARKVFNCDHLILSDSVIRRISTVRFAPNMKTEKRFIRGGAATCTNFVERFGSSFNTKNILLHVGTRDLQKNGVIEEEFITLLETCLKIWKNSQIYVSLITQRKDIPTSQVHAANQVILSACSYFSQITVIDQFKPTENMFYDNVHLNNKVGLPAIVNHLKSAMNIPIVDQVKPQHHRTQEESTHRPFSAPPPSSQSVPYKHQNNNLDMSRPLSTPSNLNNSQPTSSVQHVNMMNSSPPIPYHIPPWFPMNQPNGAPQWNQPWTFPPFNPWHQNDMFPHAGFSH